MIKTCFTPIVLGLALASSLSVQISFAPTKEIWTLTDIDFSDNLETKKLARCFAKLNDVLTTKLPDNENPEENIRASEKLLENIGSGLFGKNKSQKEAMKLFISLADTVDQCSPESSLILTKNLIANQAVEHHYSAWTTRTRKAFDHYHEKHARYCRSFYRDQFRELSKQINEEDLQKLESTLGNIEAFDFHYFSGQFRNLARKAITAMALDRLAEKPCPEATYKMLDNVIEQVKKSGDWAALKPYVDEKGFKTVHPRVPKQIFDQYLFGPCKEYTRTLGSVLGQARLDAVVEDSANFLTDEEQFYRALITSQLCKSVLKEEPQLYEVFANEWSLRV